MLAVLDLDFVVSYVVHLLSSQRSCLLVKPLCWCPHPTAPTQPPVRPPVHLIGLAGTGGALGKHVTGSVRREWLPPNLVASPSGQTLAIGRGLDIRRVRSEYGSQFVFFSFCVASPRRPGIGKAPPSTSDETPFVYEHVTVP